ncbi:zinc finger protein ZFP2-like isoform X1 [Centropristis striata]|uniref:zinc finger protein ZFP2-like isoform X1 n=1 Tax=Centropristis striata TaxID=184440 RepID=UPI0027E0AB05|nr:zinc finger protein ZFP2-like isoform X1 [Centropristis striata]
MSTVETLRQFVSERLTAAAEEIFGVLEKTLVVYEDEIDRQRKLLDIFWKPEIKLHRIELQQQHVCKEEEVLVDQPLSILEIKSSLEQEDPDPPQNKGEQQELCTGQEGEQLVLEQETEALMLTPTPEESDHDEAQTVNLSIDETQSAVEEMSAESQDQNGGQHLDSGSAGSTEPRLKRRHRKNRSHSNKINNADMSNIHRKTQTRTKPIECDTCRKCFKNDDLLKSHMKVHTDEKPYSCKTCGKDFRNNAQLKVHIRTHTGEKPYLCNTCGNRFINQRTLTRHIRTHTDEKPYSCKTCGKGFRRKAHLTVHMRTHTGEKPYMCKTCGTNFMRKDELKVHMRTHTGEKPYSCKTCGKDFRSKAPLTVHMRTHTELQQQHFCKEEDVFTIQPLIILERSSSPDQEDPDPPQNEGEQQELCTGQEGEQLVLEQETDALMLTPTPAESDHGEAQTVNLSIDETQSVVEEMSAESQDQNGGQHRDSGSARSTGPPLKRRLHKKRSHSNNINNVDMSEFHRRTQTGKKPNECDTCVKCFKNDYLLKLHMRVHTDEKPYSCKTCRKDFRRKDKLKEHMRTHTGERPYPCKTCGKGFRRNAHLTVHLRSHTGEKPYTCKICGKCFGKKEHLDVHKRIHTGEKPYMCKTCGTDFMRKDQLNVHMRTHTGEKPHTCKTCGKCFRHNGDLTVHMRTHTGEKPYFCKTCGKCFTFNTRLKVHMRRDHTEEKQHK